MLLEFCQKVGANLRLDWNRKRERWRVGIMGAEYKLAAKAETAQDGTLVTIHYFVGHYKPLQVYSVGAFNALALFVAQIRGAKMRLHGQVYIVPLDLTAPSLSGVLSPEDDMLGPCTVGPSDKPALLVVKIKSKSKPKAEPKFPFKITIGGGELKEILKKKAESEAEPKPKPEPKVEPFF
jgi:hypothetical protein